LNGDEARLPHDDLSHHSRNAIKKHTRRNADTMRLSSCLVLAIAGTVSLLMAPHSVLARETPSLRRAIGDSRHRKGAFSPDPKKPTGGTPNNLSSFMSDLTTVSNEQKVKLLLSARALQKVTEHIDWEKLRDEYLTATYGSKRRQRKLESTRSMRNSENGDNVNNLDMASLKAQLDKEVQMAIDKAIPNHSSQSGQTNMQSSSKVNGADKNGNKTFHSRVGTNIPLVFEVPTPQADGERAQARAQTDDGIPIPNYVYSTGSCPGAGNSPAAVPCAPTNLDQMCDKYDSNNQGKFSLCFNACIPSFCCIHDAPPATNSIAPNCNTDSNCAQYASCYIVWWKLHDTIGPATQLIIEQNDDFFDVPNDFIQVDLTNEEFYREMLFHHFNDANEIIRLGTVEVNSTLSVFDSDSIFLNSTYWNTTI